MILIIFLEYFVLQLFLVLVVYFKFHFDEPLQKLSIIKIINIFLGTIFQHIIFLCTNFQHIFFLQKFENKHFFPKIIQCVPNSDMQLIGYASVSAYILSPIKYKVLLYVINQFKIDTYCIGPTMSLW